MDLFNNRKGIPAVTEPMSLTRQLLRALAAFRRPAPVFMPRPSRGIKTRQRTSDLFIQKPTQQPMNVRKAKRRKANKMAAATRQAQHNRARQGRSRRQTHHAKTTV